MPQITLKAKLQAYTKTPFYGDYIREPKALLPDYDPNIAYVFRDGSWIDLAVVSSELGISIEDLRNTITEIENNLLQEIRTVNVDVDYSKDQLIFTNSRNENIFKTLPTSKVDGETIGKNLDGNMYVLDQPDGKTIVVDNIVYEKDDFNIDVRKVSGELRVDGIAITNNPKQNMSQEEILDYDSKYISGHDLHYRLKSLEKNVKDLEEFTQGTGGFLDPYRFFYPDDKYNKTGKPLLSLEQGERDAMLTQYAKDQLGRFPDSQTKIKDLYDGRIWVFSDNTWQDEGQDTVVTANNNGILGAVTGVAYDENNLNTKFKISIDKSIETGVSTGTMSVNGLADEFTKVVYDKDSDINADSNTYVKRTNLGTIIANPGQADNEVITVSQLNAWQSQLLGLDKAIIDQLVDENFKTVSNGGIN